MKSTRQGPRHSSVVTGTPAAQWFLMAAALLAGCAQPVKVTQSVTIAAEHGQAAQVRRVAVLPFASARRELDASPDVETMLASIRLNDRPYFVVVERTRIQQIITQQRFSESALVDPATAVRVGKLIGAEAVYTGTVNRGETADRSYQQTRSVCQQYEQTTRKGVTTQGKCLQWVQRALNCTERTATFAMMPKLVRVQTGDIAFAEAIEGKRTAQYCQGDDGGLASGEELLAQARTAAVDTLRRKVAPNVQQVAVNFVTDAEGITRAGARSRHEGAVEYAKAGRTDRACELWREALQLDAGARPLIHNEGACLEVSGQYARALQAYEAADRAGTRPDKTISESIARVRRLMDNQNRLRTQTGG